MQVGDWVQVYSGDYKGYYGTIKEVGQGVVRVAHREDFFGFWIDDADLVPPPVEVVEPENE